MSEKKGKKKAELVRSDDVAEAEAELAEAERKRKAALLKLQLAKLERGEDVDLQALAKTDESQGRRGRGGGGLSILGDGSVEGVIGTLGGLPSLMNSMGVEDETPPDKEGNTVKFTRHAGRVKNVRLKRRPDGTVEEEVDFEPEEWPPRSHGFGPQGGGERF
jgi:hypothetical protein